MIDDVIAYAFDDDGNRTDLTLGDVYDQCGEMLKIMYFDGMIRGQSDNPEGYVFVKKMILECLEIILDDIHDKYEDHIEDARNQIFGPKEKNDPEGTLNG